MKKTSRFTRAMEVLSLVFLTSFTIESWGVASPAESGLYLLAASMVAVWIVIDT